MPDVIATGNNISACRKCGTTVRFHIDDNWRYDEETKSGYPIVTYNFEPKFCPVCGSSDVEVTDEKVDYWQFLLRAADWRIAPETVALAEQLYKTWERGEVSFVQHLIDFKASIAAKESA